MPFAELMTLERPPVQVMRTTVFFDSSPRIPSPAAGLLYDLWSAEYPSISESYPMPPIGESIVDPDDDDDVTPPMPFYAFEGATRAVLFQGDRIALTWNSDPVSSTYPTFRVLATELLEKFEDLVALTRDRFNSVVQASRVDVKYVNKVIGIRADEYAVRVLAGFEQHGDLQPNSPRDSIVLSSHWHEDESLGWVRIGSDSPDSTSVDITVRRPLADMSLEDCLEAVHRVAINAFVRNTSDSMRQEWGRR